jgi:hypothetical protein
MSILTTFTNLVLKIKQKSDVKNIAIYEQENNTEVFQNVKYLDGSVSDDLKVMEHPKEDGATIVDHVVDDPKTAVVKIIIEDEDVESLNEILDCYKNRTPLTIKIKNEIYSNFIISAKPLKADAEHYDKTVYDLSFKEVMQAKTVYVKMSVPEVKNKTNASKIKTGHKQGIAKKEAKPSILRSLTNKITGRK